MFSKSIGLRYYSNYSINTKYCGRGKTLKVGTLNFLPILLDQPKIWFIELWGDVLIRFTEKCALMFIQCKWKRRTLHRHCYTCSYLAAMKSFVDRFNPIFISNFNVSEIRVQDDFAKSNSNSSNVPARFQKSYRSRKKWKCLHWNRAKIRLPKINWKFPERSVTLTLCIKKRQRKRQNTNKKKRKEENYVLRIRFITERIIYEGNIFFIFNFLHHPSCPIL